MKLNTFLDQFKQPSGDLKTNHWRTTYVGYVCLFLLFGVGIIWMGSTVLAGAIVASGAVAVEGKPKAVQHPDGGIVAAINVKDGSLVKKGQVVIRLDDTLLRADLNIYTNQLLEAVAKQNRLIAEREGRDRIIWDLSLLEALDVEPSKGITEGQEKLFKARLRTRNGQIDQLTKRVAQFRSQLVSYEFQRMAANNQVTLLNEELVGLEKLHEKGLVAMRQVRTTKRQLEELISNAGGASAEMARMKNSINEVDLQILQVELDFTQAVLTELSDVELEIKNLTQQILATRTKLDRTEVRAPVNGMVHELSVFTVGGVIGQGTALMSIVPQTEVLQVEIKIEPQFIDQVHIGQNAGVRFAAFNQKTTQELTGIIAAVSPATTIDPTFGNAYYAAKVQITDEERQKLGGERLIPGMPVEVFVKTAERTALNYLFKPLTEQLYRAFRED